MRKHTLENQSSHPSRLSTVFKVWFRVLWWSVPARTRL